VRDFRPASGDASRTRQVDFTFVMVRARPEKSK
jgi:hydroxyquinol 1,2-dioxygenase